MLRASKPPTRREAGSDRRNRAAVETKGDEPLPQPVPRRRSAPAPVIEALRRQRAAHAARKLAAREGTYNDRGFVFANESGNWLDLDAGSKAFSGILRDLGTRVRGLSLHSLRHVGGTTALATANDARTVSELLSHAGPSVTL